MHSLNWHTCQICCSWNNIKHADDTLQQPMLQITVQVMYALRGPVWILELQLTELQLQWQHLCKATCWLANWSSSSFCCEMLYLLISTAGFPLTGSCHNSLRLSVPCSQQY